MSKRIELHEKLCDLIQNNHVYFQPPESVKLTYPCFIYRYGGYNVKHANNKNYIGRDYYEVIYFDKNPDNTMVHDFIDYFPLSRFGRHYTSDNINHYTFTLYY